MIISSLLPQCIDAARLLEDVNVKENPGADVSSVPKMAAAILSHILQGHCFRRRNLPSPAFFTNYIFQSLNRTSNLQIIGTFKSTVGMLCMFKLTGIGFLFHVLIMFSSADIRRFGLTCCTVSRCSDFFAQT